MVILLLAAVGCGGTTGQGPVDPETGFPAAVTERVVDASPTPGSCTTLTYTPPGAKAAGEADLCLPRSPQGPAVVLVHGGGGTGGTRTDFEVWRRWYDDRGVTTLNIDYRTLDGGPLWPVPEQQTAAAVQLLRANARPLGIDPAAIIVHGASAGARIGAVAYTGSLAPDLAGPTRWNAVPATVNGFVGFYGYYDGFVFEADRYYPGSATPAAADAVENAAAASGPALLVHGQADPIVGSAGTEAFADALRGASIDVELVLVPGAGHGFDGYGEAALTERGREVAATLAAWLDRHFPTAGSGG